MQTITKPFPNDVDDVETFLILVLPQSEILLILCFPIMN